MGHVYREQWSGNYVRIPFEHGWKGSDGEVAPQEWRRREAVPSHNWGGSDVPGREALGGMDPPLTPACWGGNDIPGRHP